MIEIKAWCHTCGARWVPRVANGPDADYEAAKTWAEAHIRRNAGHTVQATNTQQTKSERGSRFEYVDLEITRR